MKLIAIDPGLSGGVVTLSDVGVIAHFKMPRDMKNLYYLFLNNSDCTVVLEDVGFHVKGNSASASVVFARHVERIKTYLEITGNPIELVKPRTWQSPLGLTSGMGAKAKQKRKQEVKTLMGQKYHYIGRITNYTADAVGIFDWYINRNTEFIDKGVKRGKK